jgi:hypothetical protein
MEAFVKRVVVLLSVLSMLIATTPAVAFGQSTDPKREKKAREVKEKIQKLGTGRNAVVKIKLYSDTEYKGYVSRASDDNFEVTDPAGNAHLVRYDDVRSIGGKNMSTGAKIGIGVGIGAGVTLLILLLIFNELAKNS